MFRRYADFEVVIDKYSEQLNAYLGTAPGGHHLSKRVPITLPIDREAWIEVCQGSKKDAKLAELGYQLFTALIKGELAEKWAACLAEVRQEEGTGLRLRFSYEAGSILAHVPLEVLCRETRPTRKFLALDPETPIVRSPLHGEPTRKWSGSLPLRMLVVIANPKLYIQNEPLEQKRLLDMALESLAAEKRLMIDYLGLPDGPKADYTTLQSTLLRASYPYDIVHFVGYGSSPDGDETDPEGTLLLVDTDSGFSSSVRASDMASMLAQRGVRLVVLQACEGGRDGTESAFQGAAQQLIAWGLPAVLAMQCPVQKDVAAHFCQRFYSFWLDGGERPIELAVTEARRSVRKKFPSQPSAWVMPVLFMRGASTEVLAIKEDWSLLSMQLKRGRVLLESGRWDEAVDEFEKVYRVVPERARNDLIRALESQVRARQKNGDAEGTLEGCDKLLQISPNNATALQIGRFVPEVPSEVEPRGWWISLPDPTGMMEDIWGPGDILGEEYEILNMLAVTKCCEIYHAVQLKDSRQVAIKRLKPEGLKSSQIAERFKREVAVLALIVRLSKILSNVEHGSVLRLLDDCTEETGDRYFVTEFADRESLRKYIEEKPGERLHPAEALDIAKDVCQGIEAIHGLGFIHRDIKPGNVFVFSDPDHGVRAKLGDFSIARVPETWQVEPLTEQLEFLGTPAYAAPEQFRSIFYDMRSDLYSWAVVFLEMLVGQSFTEIRLGRTEVGLREALKEYYEKSEDEFPRTLFEDRGIPKEFIPVLQRALRKDPENRYQSARDILDDLDAIKYSIVEDIERHLKSGREKAGSREWKAADAAFQRGLELWLWCDEPPGSPTDWETLIQQLKVGRLHIEGMLLLSSGQWQNAIKAFEALERLDSNYLTWEQRTEWLESFIELTPDQEKSRFQDELDAVRYQWAEALNEEGKRHEAITQLERLSTEARNSASVQDLLRNAYNGLGDEHFMRMQWIRAISYWLKSIRMRENIDAQFD